MSTPYETATAVLDAAGSGSVMPGYEEVGFLLVGLGQTHPIPAGTAITTPAVAAASAASTPGMFATAARWLKPAGLIASVVAVGVVVFTMATGGGSDSPVVTVPADAGGNGGVSRVVDSATTAPTGGDPADPRPDGTPTSSEQPSSDAGARGSAGGPGVSVTTEGSGDPSDTGARPAVSTTAAPDSTGTTPATTVPPTAGPRTTVPPTPAPSPTAPPVAPPAAPPTTTVAPPAEPPVTTTTFGNNGNGNGKGKGNGKGNKGKNE